MKTGKTNQEMIEILKNARSNTDIARALGYKYYNGRLKSIVNSLIKEYNVDVSHFDKNGSWRKRKYRIIQKQCPVCSSEFECRVYDKGKTDVKKYGKSTCGKSCSNTFFRSFSNEKYLKNHTGSKASYRSLCFQYWDKRCALCDWVHTLEVHHVDENRKHNNKENLVPLCQNHHKITLLSKNSPIRKEVEEQIKNIMSKKKWIRIFSK